MIEVEMKFPISEVEQLQQQLRALGVQFSEAHTEADSYFNAPDRDFACTDEALRLRRVGEHNVLTYKGPKLDAQTKTRVEVEVPLADGEQAAQQATALLTHLGYRPVAVIQKKRTTGRLAYHGFPIEVSLDQVDGLGLYMELEVAASDRQVDEARRAVQDLAARLGLTQSERRSYLELGLEKRSSQDHVR